MSFTTLQSYAKLGSNIMTTETISTKYDVKDHDILSKISQGFSPKIVGEEKKRKISLVCMHL